MASVHSLLFREPRSRLDSLNRRKRLALRLLRAPEEEIRFDNGVLVEVEELTGRGRALAISWFTVRWG
jgi:hypothetical protein